MKPTTHSSPQFFMQAGGPTDRSSNIRFGAVSHTEVTMQAVNNDQDTVHPYSLVPIARKETGTRDGVDAEVKVG